jgi:hypothetical protein
MRRAFGLALALGVCSHPLSADNATTPLTDADQRVETVRQAYFAPMYAAPLTVLLDAATKGHGKIVHDEAFVKTLAEANSLKVALRYIAQGTTSEIGSQLLKDFLSFPSPGQEILKLDATGTTGSKDYGRVEVHWAAPEQRSPGADDLRTPISELITRSDDAMEATYDRYVSYTVDLSYGTGKQAKSVSYKALYLFATDAGKDIVVDMFFQGPRYSQVLGAYRPDRVLLLDLRDVPEIHDYLLAHTTTDPRCGMNQLCCLTGQCLYRLEDFNRKMKYNIHRQPSALIIPLAPLPGISVTPETACGRILRTPARATMTAVLR